jgi:hypothetical protein
MLICPIKNIISANISALSHTVGSSVSYYLTTKSILIVNPSLSNELIPLTEIESARVTRYNKQNSLLVLHFRAKDTMLKIVDDFLVCQQLMSFLNEVLM